MAKKAANKIRGGDDEDEAIYENITKRDKNKKATDVHLIV